MWGVWWLSGGSGGGHVLCVCVSVFVCVLVRECLCIPDEGDVSGCELETGDW